MKTEFDNWWDKDLLTEDNPHVEGTQAFWAWEGWVAGVNAEREACAKVCEDEAFVDQWKGLAEAVKRIRARGQS